MQNNKILTKYLPWDSKQVAGMTNAKGEDARGVLGEDLREGGERR